ncbi:MAG: cupin domain-containing protein [Cyclobacteriaceae bacterium]
MEKVNLAEKFKMIPDHWHPHVAGRLNGQSVKLVRVLGEFVWHHHDLEDELFLVISGVLHMELRDRTIVVQPGEFIIIPRGLSIVLWRPQRHTFCCLSLRKRSIQAIRRIVNLRVTYSTTSNLS